MQNVINNLNENINNIELKRAEIFNDNFLKNSVDNIINITSNLNDIKINNTLLSNNINLKIANYKNDFESI